MKRVLVLQEYRTPIKAVVLEKCTEDLLPYAVKMMWHLHTEEDARRVYDAFQRCRTMPETIKPKKKTTKRK